MSEGINPAVNWMRPELQVEAKRRARAPSIVLPTPGTVVEQQVPRARAG